MLIHNPKKFLSLATVTFAIFTVVQSASLSKRIQSNAPGWDPHSTSFPSVQCGDVVFQYRSEAAKGNVSIPDPYNWFETSNASDFVNAQLAFTKTYVDKLEDLDVIRSVIKDTDAYFPLYAPTAFGLADDPTYHYYFKDKGVKFWRSYICKQKDLDEAARTNFTPLPGKVLIDDSLLKGKVTRQQEISPDGTKVLYSVIDPVTYGDSRVYVRDVSNSLSDKSQEVQEGGYGHYPDVVSGHSESWSGDSKSFFYTSPDGSVRHHVLGADVKDDPVLVKPNKDGKTNWWTDISDDGKYVFVSGQEIERSYEARLVFAASLDQQINGPIKWLPIANGHDSAWDYAASVGDSIYFQTTKGAPNLQIVRFNLDFSKAVLTDDFSIFTQGAEGVTVIPERPDAKIASYAPYDKDKILLVYNKDDAVELIAFSLTTGAQLQKVALDTLSTSAWLQGSSSSTDVYVQITSLNTQSKFYHLKWDRNAKSFSSQLAFEQKSGTVDPDKYIVELQWAPSKTGNVTVPFYILRRKDLKLDGSHPALINFFGAIDYSLPTHFNPNHYAFVQNYDAVYILAAPRGGGELGDDWHKGGQLKDKQNTFDDVRAVIDYAIDQKWTSPGKVIIKVESHGTVAGAAVVNQAPEGLIGAFIGSHGYFDLLRIEQSKYKDKLVPEYGSPSDPKAFDWLRKYSPLHNINPKKAYPTILIFPSDDDSETEAWHSYKYISQLQYELPNNPSPLLLGNNTGLQSDRDAVAFALVAHTLGLKRVN
ncbi:uncharacterized protein FA14DRAFT_152258 [Meira miltonrushii]|uniref:Prolyl endopeptidase n=1 Tax=Meira miltonrushii TaxID=1280837 RepID=A0A316VMQ1_9BASI|nr:uncharacterized protein FA14DRAFT_152258 [Meira miltonrushii]PWN36835.1 hypothetical protein FA14DRAFT_152258 [Meira miltonrushii]